MKEQESFDKYACWCEKTMERKAADIAHAKEVIAETQVLIKKLKGEIASHGAEIQQLNKDIAQNKEAVKDATELRNKEHKEYFGERTESEQCIGALEAAIKVLTGAGTGFLQGSIRQAELMSVVVGVQRALSRKAASEILSSGDVEIMKHFVAKPEDFVDEHTGAIVAAQVSQNPFGDYAPQSTQIQGILKGMYDAFTADVEKDNAEEADKQKAFEELMATKKQELATLEATLEKQEHDEAKKTKELSDNKITRDDTIAQLKADEIFFQDTKDGCKQKAGEWAERSRLRTEELTGIAKEIQILSSPEARQTFQSSVTTFVQLSTDTKTVSHQYRKKAYTQLRSLAAKYQSTSLAEIAVGVKT